MYNELLFDYIKRNIDQDIVALRGSDYDISNHDKIMVAYYIDQESINNHLSFKVTDVHIKELICYARKNKLKKLIKRIENV
jgi:hypothetical protein